MKFELWRWVKLGLSPKQGFLVTFFMVIKAVNFLFFIPFHCYHQRPGRADSWFYISMTLQSSTCLWLFLQRDISGTTQEVLAAPPTQRKILSTRMMNDSHLNPL